MAEQVGKIPTGKKDLIAVVIVAFVGLMLGLNLFQLLDSDGGGDLVGKTAPEFSLPLLGEEENMNLMDYRGQVVVMDFWATWCPPCREQMPALEAVATDPELGEDVVLFSINTDEPSQERENLIERFLSEEELTLPTVMDTGTVRRLYGVTTIPTLVIIDREGVVTHRSAGLHQEPDLRRLISQAADSL